MVLKVPALSLLALLLAAPARGLEVGRTVDFPDGAMNRRADFPAGSGVAWESGPSAPVEADFKALLFQGTEGGPALVFEAAVESGGRWGPWTAAQGERFKNGRFWAKFVVAGRKGDRVRVRASRRDPGPSGWVEFYGLDASGMEEEEGGRAVWEVSSSVPPSPDASPRSAWGARPAKKPYEPMTPDRITVHHTESARPMTREAAVEELQAIQAFHQRGRGWVDIGYQFLIDGGGGVWEGRPAAVMGAHVKERNEGNIGISLMGDFHRPRGMKPTQAQLDSLIALARRLSSTYGIPAERIVGHRDQERTTCPGDNIYSRLQDVRRAVSEPAPPLAAGEVRCGAAAAKVEAMPVFAARIEALFP